MLGYQLIKRPRIASTSHACTQREKGRNATLKAWLPTLFLFHVTVMDGLGINHPDGRRCNHLPGIWLVASVQVNYPSIPQTPLIFAVEITLSRECETLKKKRRSEVDTSFIGVSLSSQPLFSMPFCQPLHP